jgi:hypothetical protein
MIITDLLGFLGVSILLLAFFLNLRGVMRNNNSLYLTLNVIGAGMACLASVMLHYWPFIILEGCWTMVSLVSLVSAFKTTKAEGETDLSVLLKTMRPKLHEGDYVFCTGADLNELRGSNVIMLFKEDESETAIVRKETADNLKLKYSFVASWITLTVHSSLDAVGLTAAISNALAQSGISCNVVAAYYHDHIFVSRSDATRTMQVLNKLST